MTGTLEITILGCGSSGGVPRVGGDWGACDPLEPKNRRTRCSILVDYWEEGAVPPKSERTSILIDTSPDLREQFLAADVQRVDAVLYTHEHADQTHGIDDLRAIAYRMRRKIPTYMNTHTRRFMMERFGYCFEMPDGRVHPAILDAQPNITSDDELTIDGPGGALKIDVMELSHGATPVLGFRFGKQVVYTPDVYDIDDDVIEFIQQPALWIIDALRYNTSPSHANVDKALSWLARTQTRKAVFTNMHIDLDYETLRTEIPKLAVPAYDGMLLQVKV